MGDWGPGNFQNDHCLDHFAKLIGPILNQVRQIAADEALMDPDRDGDLMMANVEIILALIKGIKPYPGEVPSAEEVLTWKADFLRVWDECNNYLDPNDPSRNERRKIISSAFDRLHRQLIQIDEKYG